MLNYKYIVLLLKRQLLKYPGTLTCFMIIAEKELVPLRIKHISNM